MAGIASLEQRVLIERWGKVLWTLRRQPWHAAYYLSGIALPPHERLWLGVFFGETKNNDILASRGTSKCLQVGTKVIMYDGTLRNVEDVRVGDQVMGPDGTPRTVLDTTRGVGPLFKVRQSSGEDYVVNDAHVLSLKKANTARQRPTGVFSQWAGDVVNIPVQEFAAQSPYVRSLLRGYKVPALAFPEQPVTIDPYLLGLWLGDGHRHRPCITTADPEVVGFLESWAAAHDFTVTVTHKPGNRASTYNLIDNQDRGGCKGGNRLTKLLREYDILTSYSYDEENASCAGRPHNKRIPQAYITNSETVRLQILAGLVDSDGTKNDGAYNVVQKSEALARDIKYLADTLGFRTSIVRRVVTSQNGYVGEAWAVRIGGDVNRIPCLISRKRILARDLRKNKDWRLSQVTVEAHGDGEWAGFALDGDHLFLLADGTVTHNSFTLASLAAPLKAVLYKDTSILTLSASGFRGGKELFKDAERMFSGQLKSQQLPGTFLKASLAKSRILSKDPSIWSIDLRSNSRYATAPTNNPDQLRGLRANEVILDERAFFDQEIPHRIIRPMIVVGMDFRRAAQGGDRNKIFQVSTIDFTVRDWWKELEVARRDMRDEHTAWKARKAGDWAEYDRMLQENDGRLQNLSFSYSRVDYTDLLIPDRVATLDGERVYRVHYPVDPGLAREDVLRYDEQDKVSYWYTYPVDKKSLEEPLRAGTVDRESWLSEQRNIPISASGNVFDYALIQKVAERPIPVHKRRVDSDGETADEYFAPLLFTCGDPCVLSVDVARESDDVTFVVTRLGEKADGEFSPFTERTDDRGRTLLGRTSWNHICWAENHRGMTAFEVAEKIRELSTRYNLIHQPPSLELPDGIGGIAMDKKGGGSAVRDELGNPKPPVVDGVPLEGWKWDDVVKIYDPTDVNGYGHYAASRTGDPKFWGGLRLVNAQNADNSEWTFGIRGMMQAGKLYIAFWMPPSQWAWEKGLVTPNGEPDRQHPEFVKWEVGYRGIRRLKAQLLRLQTRVSEQGVIRFGVPGDRTKEDGKKDFWAALIYGFPLIREHLKVREDAQGPEAPMVAPLLVQMPPNPLLAGLLGPPGRRFF